MKREEFEPKNVGKRLWFCIKYPLLSIVAAILITSTINGTVEGIKNHFQIQELKAEKEEAEKLETVGKPKDQKEDQKEDQMEEQKEEQKGNKTSKEETMVSKIILPEYQSLWEKNKDMIGWLTIPETGVDYPVMYRLEDDNYYLSHGFNKTEDKNGLLVLDKRCDITQSGGQHIIYGHNMRSGAMFGNLLNYKEKAYYEYNPIIEFDSIYEKGSYEIISVFVSKIFYQDEEGFRFYDYTKFTSEEEFRDYYDTIKKRSLYKINAEASYHDTLLCLVTCEYTDENGRLVIVAKKVEQSTESVE
ncbi:MAG: class B sortase [Acetivibrio sp.]